VIVQKIDEDIVLVDGLHRVEDAIALGDQPIDVAVLDGDMTDLLCRNLFLDHARGKPQIGDMVRVIRVLYEESHLDPDQIKEKTGYPRDYIEKLIKISTASPVVQEALDEGWIGVGIAFELSRLPSALVQEEIVAKHQVYHFTVPEVKERVDAILKELELIKEAPPAVVPGATRPTPVYHCEGCKDEIEPRYLRAVMLCPDCFGEVWSLAKARIPTPEGEIEETPTP